MPILNKVKIVIFNRYEYLKYAKLLYLIVSLLHLLFIACYMLSLDFTRHPDAKVRKYQSVKWRMITTWFNLSNILYLLTSVFCEWNAYGLHRDSGLIKALNKLRTHFFNNIIFPVTMTSNVLFWKLYNKNPELLAPAGAYSIVPFWAQHSMHTVSVVVVLLDLLLMPREKPTSHRQGITVMSAFIGTYFFMLGLSISNEGEFVYSMFENFSTFKLFIFMVYFYISNLFYYFIQWSVLDIVWKHR